MSMPREPLKQALFCGMAVVFLFCAGGEPVVQAEAEESTPTGQAAPEAPEAPESNRSATELVAEVADASIGTAPAVTPSQGGGGGQGNNYSASAVTNGGTIVGKVTFAGSIPELPKRPIDKDTGTCGSEARPSLALMVSDGDLKNAVVYLTGITSGKAFADNEFKVDQQKCEYTPHVLAVPVEAELEIVNSDAVLHNVNANLGEETLFNIAQPIPGMSSYELFETPGMVKLECFVHPWMTAYVFVAENPYYSVTGSDGAFRLDDVPAGEYSLHVWHEHLGEQTQDVEITGGAETTANFELMPQ